MTYASLMTVTIQGHDIILIDKYLVPIFDIEIGSTLESWKNPVAESVLANSLFRVFDDDIKPELKDIKVADWINIENYNENKKFILEWYKFIKALTFRLKFVRDEDEIENINQILLDSFYRVKIDNDFYKSFEKLLPEVKNKLGII